MAWDEQAYEDKSIRRGIEKLESIRAGYVQLQPVGWFAPSLVLALLLGILPGVGFIAWGISRESPGKLAVNVVFGLVFLAIGAWVIRDCKPDTPRRAVTLFLRAVCRGEWAHAQGLVVPNDLDDFPRFHSDDVDGRSSEARFFDRADGFAAYWKTLLRGHAWPWRTASIGCVSVRYAAPDVAVIRFRLTFGSLRSWLLSSRMLTTNHNTICADMTKIVIRAGGEWHLFNGAWQGFEEEFNDWIEA